MPVKHLKLGSVHGELPVQASSDGEDGEEGQHREGSVAQSKSGRKVCARHPRRVGGASPHEELDVEDSRMAGHEGLQRRQYQDYVASLKKDPSIKIKWIG